MRSNIYSIRQINTYQCVRVGIHASSITECIQYGFSYADRKGIDRFMLLVRSFEFTIIQPMMIF